MSESKEQVALIKWCDLKGHPYNKIFAIPNGGKRNAREAARLKREGVKSGVLDLLLPVARGDFHGLFIEMKYKYNKLTSNQEKWMNDLLTEGYLVIVCYTWDSAREQIETYLELLPD